MYKVLLMLLLASCAVSKEPDCFKRAIVLLERTRMESVDIEYAYLRANYPGCRLKSQKVESFKGRTYDILTFYPRNSHRPTRVYFDVTAFYSKHFK